MDKKQFIFWRQHLRVFGKIRQPWHGQQPLFSSGLSFRPGRPLPSFSDTVHGPVFCSIQSRRIFLIGLANKSCLSLWKQVYWCWKKPSSHFHLCLNPCTVAEVIWKEARSHAGLELKLLIPQDREQRESPSAFGHFVCLFSKPWNSWWSSWKHLQLLFEMEMADIVKNLKKCIVLEIDVLFILSPTLYFCEDSSSVVFGSKEQSPFGLPLWATFVIGRAKLLDYPSTCLLGNTLTKLLLGNWKRYFPSSFSQDASWGIGHLRTLWRGVECVLPG